MPAVTQFRFFSEKVFGVWVSARVTAVGRKYVTVRAMFKGIHWTEKLRYGTEVYSDPGGHAFILTKEAVSCPANASNS